MSFDIVGYRNHGKLKLMVIFFMSQVVEWFIAAEKDGVIMGI